ncbi:hypothetical protein ACYOEI_01085 [Singulisphaera rosea]
MTTTESLNEKSQFDRVRENAAVAFGALMATPSSNEVLAALGIVTGWIHTELSLWKAQNAQGEASKHKSMSENP